MVHFQILEHMINQKVVGNLGLGTDLGVDNPEARTDTGVDLEVRTDIDFGVHTDIEVDLGVRTDTEVDLGVHIESGVDLEECIVP